MSSTNHRKMTKSLAFRLTLMYACICAVSLGAVLAFSYLALEGTLRRKLDEGMLNEVEEYASLLAAQDMEVMQDVLDEEAVSEGTDRVFFRMLDKTGNVILTTDMRAWTDVDVKRPYLLAALEGETVLDTHRHEGRTYPARIVYGWVGPELVLQLGESTAWNAEVLYHFRQVFAVVAVGFLFCSVVAGGLMARRALSGVQRVTQAARDISAGTWDSRVPLSHRQDEIDELAAAFNEMIERIQVLIRELREVTDDIAHDLRTPIARMRVAAETALGEPEANLGQQEMAGSMLEECDHLLGLINTTLEISQTEAGARPLARSQVDISAIAEDVCEFFRPAAEDKGVTTDFTEHPGLVVDGDPGKLKRALAHIVDNAVKYTSSGGQVSVTCERRNSAAIVSVMDTGQGIPEEDLEKVFARFYRVDQSRSQGGNGLGLSLSRAICRAHGGDVTVTSEPGEGSSFELSIPVPAKK